MIQYKDGRLHIPGISFPIPEGFYFYTEVDSVVRVYAFHVPIRRKRTADCEPLCLTRNHWRCS